MNIFDKLENKLDKLNERVSDGKLNLITNKFIKSFNQQMINISNILSSKTLDKKYDHIIIEKHKMFKWKVNDFLKVHDESKKPFTIILPPPNITGELHLGHAWNTTIQDAIIRYKRLNGFDTLFIPSMDHAGIATQAKVESELAKRNIYKDDIGKNKFLDEVWKWKEQYTKRIRAQWSKLGILFDSDKEIFTLDKPISNAVNKAFIDMYNDGLIYRGEKAINWDCKLKTSISNIEVIQKNAKSKMYYLKYKIFKSDKFIIIATTRVETLFSDVALAINPLDEKNIHLIKQYVINPLTKAKMPIITDEYVQMSKGTGIMKISAHATADIDIIIKNNLKIKECIDKNGNMNEYADKYKGLDRFIAREKIAEWLNNEGFIEKIEVLDNEIGYSQRSNTVVEILISPQWFIKTNKLAAIVLKNMNDTKDTVNFHPSRFKDSLKYWMENVKDWNISRQLWWGHQLPVWYKKKKIKVQVNSPGKNWIQDQDVLDTWFSSSLAPFSFLGWPDNTKDLQRYYPTNLLVSAYDIIFFWIARMYFNGLYFKKQIPFKDVLIHGLIRDEEGQKMSKSLGNGIDPFLIIKKYGADSLRWFLLTNSTPGQDLRFSKIKMESSWNFNNKLWNIARFIINKKNDVDKINDHDKWIINKLNILNKKLNLAYDKYEFTLIKKYIDKFVYNEFSSWYIEISKDKFNKKIALKVLSYLLIMIHPIIPFITDHIYMKINNESILNANWPTIKKIVQNNYIDDVIEITKSIREFRVLHNLKNKDTLFYSIDKQMTMKLEVLIHKLANAKVKKNKDSLFVLTNYNLYINMSDEMKIVEKKRYEKEIKILKSEIIRSKNLLSNEKFIKNASKEKIDSEKYKYKQYKNKFINLEKLYNSKYKN